MKRIWFGAALLVLILALGLLSSALMEKTWRPHAENLQRAAVLASSGDWTAARKLQAAAQDQWEQRQLLLSVLCSDGRVEQIDSAFAQLEVFSEERRSASFSSTCASLSRRLEALAQSHSFTFKNHL